jgi:hypothetical protein
MQSGMIRCMASAGTGDYFSDREQGPRPRTGETIGSAPWGGLVTAVDTRIAAGAFGVSFPEECPDGHGTAGTDFRGMGLAVLAEIPDLAEAELTGVEPWELERTKDFTGWPLLPEHLPSTLVILDLVEFCHRHVADPIELDYHGFFRHSHLSFNVASGQARWREDINRLFARNGLAYELAESGQVVRLGTPVLTDVLRSIAFQTGDIDLDELLGRARQKYLSIDQTERAESLEQLWDAFERSKTLLDIDKKAGIRKLLDRTSSSPQLLVQLDSEAQALTKIGNDFRIRHHETTKTAISDGDVDYLFHRCFAFLAHVLRLNPSH